MPSSSTAPEGPGCVSGTPNLPSDLREGYDESATNDSITSRPARGR